MSERPEERLGFKHENLLVWINASRARLLTAALTILSAHLRSGCSPQNLKPFGSFEGWSGVVRETVTWVGLPDPCLTRTKLAESADTTGDALGQLVMAWRQFDLPSHGIIVSEMLNILYPSQREHAPRDDASVAMRAAVENLVNCPPEKVPTPRQVGNKLRQLRRRVVDGLFLDVVPRRSKQGMVWRLRGTGGQT